MKYKVGDKVRIKSKEWYESNKNKEGHVRLEDGYTFWWNMREILGRTFDVKVVDNEAECYSVSGTYYYISDEMIEEPAKEENYGKESIFDKLAHSITEAAKEANILVEPTEDGGIKISPLEVKDKDLPIDTPVMCSCSMKGQLAWFVRFYAGNGQTWWELGKSYNETRKVDWTCIIPWDKFNPNNIEESLKYNIVK